MAEMLFYIIYSIAAPMTLVLFFGWPQFYRWAFFPKRDPDFEHRLYVYWFDEMLAYSKLGKPKKKRFFDVNGVLFEDHGSNQKFVELFDKKTGMLPLEVQQAYKDHAWKKFEEIVLES